MRVRTGGSHHQKFIVLRHPGRPELDRAYVGGIDLCHSRRDDAAHAGPTGWAPSGGVRRHGRLRPPPLPPGQVRAGGKAPRAPDDGPDEPNQIWLTTATTTRIATMPIQTAKRTRLRDRCVSSSRIRIPASSCAAARRSGGAAIPRAIAWSTAAARAPWFTPSSIRRRYAISSSEFRAAASCSGGIPHFSGGGSRQWCEAQTAPSGSSTRIAAARTTPSLMPTGSSYPSGRPTEPVAGRCGRTRTGPGDPTAKRFAARPYLADSRAQ